MIYDARRSDNEEQSAIQLKEKLHGIVGGSIVVSATFTIEATKRHQPTRSPDTNRVLDLDMMILGQD